MDKNGMTVFGKQDLNFRVLTGVSLANADDERAALLEKEIKQFHEVELVLNPPGKPILILFVTVRDQIAYEEFLANRLAQIEDISRIDSTYTQTEIKTYAVYERYPYRPIIKFEIK